MRRTFALDADGVRIKKDDRLVNASNTVELGRSDTVTTQKSLLLLNGTVLTDLPDYDPDTRKLTEHYIVPSYERYVDAAKHFDGFDLTSLGKLYTVETDGLTQKQLAFLYYAGFMPDMTEDDSTMAFVRADDLHTAGINEWDDAVKDWTWCPDEGDWDFERIREMLIRPAEHYLVFASGCRWNGADGYKIVDSFKAALERSYDCSIRVRSASPGGKRLTCVESSHDVPMGSTTVILALTYGEYEKLKDADFDTVRNFAERHL